MRPWRSLFLSGAVLFAVTSCSPPPCTTIAIDRLSPPGPVQFVTVGRHVVQQVSLQVSPTGTCDGTAVESAHAEVSDPKGLPVDATAQIVSDPTTFPPTARIEFEATQVGNYHVRAVFEPNLGSEQTEVVVGRDFSSNISATVRRHCPELLPLQNGSFLCNEVLIRSDGTVLQLEGKGSAASGDVIWSVGTERLVRYLDSGSSTPESATLDGNPPPGEYRFLLATRDELWLLTDRGLNQFVFTADGGVQAHSSLPVTNGEALYRDGNDLWVLRDSDVATTEEVVEACHTTIGLDGPGVLDTPCTSLPGTLRGVDERGIWLSRGDQNGLGSVAGSTTTVSLTLINAAQGKLQTAASYRVPSGYWTVGPANLRTRLNQATGNPPSIGGTPYVVTSSSNGLATIGSAFLPGNDGPDLVLERFATSLGQAWAGARGNTAWIVSSSDKGTTLLSSTP